MMNILILDAEEEFEVIDTTPGWNSPQEWVSFPLYPGMYRACRTLNPHNPDAMWVFIEGTRFGQREEWFQEAQKKGLKVRLLLATPCDTTDAGE